MQRKHKEHERDDTVSLFTSSRILMQRFTSGGHEYLEIRWQKDAVFPVGRYAVANLERQVG